MEDPTNKPENGEQSVALAEVLPIPQEIEEKVEVFIKESVRINPRDFSAFKHALEEFVNSWDK